MLYKKNGEKSLADELFRTPTSEYRGAPFWAWNCKMTKEILTEQIEQLKKMGFGGFHMHSRDGMDNPYLSDEFMELVRGCVEKAKKENMLAYLYDEDRWPSGAAGGLITQNPIYRQRFISFFPASLANLSQQELNEVASEARSYDVNVKDATNKKAAIEKGLPYFIAAFDVCLDEDGYLTSYTKISRSAKAKGEKWLAYSLTNPPDEWFNGACYVDTLSKTAISKFIDFTYKRYYEVVGDEFDKTIPSIFTDEPAYTGMKTLKSPFERTAARMPWTADFDTTFQKRYSISIIDHLPELFWDYSSRTSFARYAFHDHITERFTEAFSKQIGAWCKKHNIHFTGHLLHEDTLKDQSHHIGEAMRAYKHYGLPGIDMLCNWRNFNTAKQCQSVVHQTGKEGMLSELYGVTNWDFDFRGHKFQGDWQAALGVTVRVPHLSWVSMKGDSKRDYPAAISYQSSWYEEYSYVENHYARLNTALTRGKPHVRIAVIHPIESMWIHNGAAGTSNDCIKQLEQNFSNICDWLIFNQLDFDYVSECDVPTPRFEPTFTIGKMRYDVVIVPALETMRSSTVKALKAFEDAGGRLIFLGSKPYLVDGQPTELTPFDNSTLIPFNEAAIVTTLKNYRDVELVLDNGNRANNYIYQMRDDGKHKWLFICNGKWYTQPDCVNAKKTALTVYGEYEPTLYDTISGEITPIPYSIKNGKTVIPLTLYLHDSVLLKLSKTKNKGLSAARDTRKVIDVIDFKSKVPYALSEKNVLVLDIAEYTYDNKPDFSSADEILRLDRAVRLAIGIPPRSFIQPWALPKVTPTHTITLRFSFNSETTVEGAQLALENAHDSVILFDGMPVSNERTGWFTDKFIDTVAMPVIGKGKHTITLTQPISERTFTEWCYLLGDFNVLLEGTEKTLLAPTHEIGFGTITSQGLPFYGANITYRGEFEAKEDCSAIIKASYYRGALISVRIDGEEAGKIVYAPYSVEVTNVKKGKHVVELTLFGNRNNCFGAVHNCNSDWDWFGPNSWFTKGDEYSYEYQLKNIGIIKSPIITLIK